MEQSRKVNGYWNDFDHLREEINRFIAMYGTSGVMPTVTELQAHGYMSLISVIAKHGGIPIVAHKLGLSQHRKEHGYWNDFANLEYEIHVFIQEHGQTGSMPGAMDFHKHRRTDIYTAIQRHGGAEAVANRLGLQCHRKPKAYWTDLTNLKNEINNFIDLHGQQDMMPTRTELQSQGYIELCNAIQRAGGFALVAQKLGLALTGTSLPQPKVHELNSA